ncbi:hypothetical protein [Methanonatronarchaeum sp. AMET6-2]|uniref:hypothetical protein n=1 Tax=Methanonatronarchaeum sp. AMET6-2 TaxID=2933293 RepID=UPI0012282AD2|nr:hypothetical protein [Methanonatronarchaeum sp. AMET6-2]RZN63143.1 MAG: hypothetical protein EF811_01075 [Methanonatronarchaeia archaeon]UOY09437.1 hypothetical protein MU439_04055 [Methanonatronarchaeum sp. AMET6-2]
MTEVGCPSCGKTLEVEIDQEPLEKTVDCCSWTFITIPPEEPRVVEYRPTDIIQKCKSMVVYASESGEIFAVDKKQAKDYLDNL